MRKILFFVLIAAPFLMNSCNNAAESSTASPASSNNSMAEKNLASNSIVVDAFKTGDASKIDSAVASDFVGHTEGPDMGRDSLKAMIVAMKKQFADMKTDVLKTVGDDEYVFCLMRFTGTSDGTMGMPKGPYDFHSLEVSRFKDGMAVEHWSYMQPKEMMAMMPPMPKEEGKKK